MVIITNIYFKLNYNDTHQKKVGQARITAEENHIKESGQLFRTIVTGLQNEQIELFRQYTDSQKMLATATEVS